MRKFTLTTAAMLIAACSRDIQNTSAIRESVIDYLRARTAQTGLDVDLMQVEVTSVSFQRDQARANVFFRPKTGAETGGMQMNYVLDRKGDRWVVRGRTENGVNPHGASGGGVVMPSMPEGHPSVSSKP